MTVSSIFRINLTEVSPSKAPLLCALSVSANGEAIWPASGDAEQTVEIALDDLFAHLVQFWKPLMLRQIYPCDFTPDRPSRLLAEAERRWKDVPQEQTDDEASELDEFEEAHNLALAFGGIFDLPPLWLVRQNDEMLCDNGKQFLAIPYDDVRAELTRIGDGIAERLIKLSPEKWGRIVEGWKQRDRASQADLLCWAASIQANIAAKLIADGMITPPSSFEDAANDNDELVIAARMAGALPYEQIVEILDVARSFDRRSAPALESLSAKAVELLDRLRSHVSFAQGEALAILAREELGVGSGERVNVFESLETLGVEVRVDAVGPETFDGLAIAGPRHGPAAFVNANAGRVRNGSLTDLDDNVGARVNLAHELCHLLVDREHPMSAVDVMRSRMPSAVEARARAFAGEFLLPSASAAAMWNEADGPVEIEALTAVLQRLHDAFGVSFSVASWKIEHGVRANFFHGDMTRFNRLKAVLDEIVPNR